VLQRVIVTAENFTIVLWLIDNYSVTEIGNLFILANSIKQNKQNWSIIQMMWVSAKWK
jgi:hypothetical protein